MLEWLFGDRRALRRLEWKFTQLERKVGRIMATQAELAQQLTDLGAKIDKIGTETAGLQTEIVRLGELIATAPVSAELQAAFDSVKAKAAVVDDLVADAEPPTP